MDLGFLSSMGVNIVPVVVVMTIAASWLALYVMDERDGVINHPALRVVVPFVMGIFLFLLWKFSNGTIGRVDVWDGFVNAAVSVGLYAPIKSFLKKQGFSLGDE